MPASSNPRMLMITRFIDAPPYALSRRLSSASGHTSRFVSPGSGRRPFSTPEFDREESQPSQTADSLRLQSFRLPVLGGAPPSNNCHQLPVPHWPQLRALGSIRQG